MQGVLMNRGDLSTEQWERLKPLLPPQKPRTGKPFPGSRTNHVAVRLAVKSIVNATLLNALSTAERNFDGFLPATRNLLQIIQP